MEVKAVLAVTTSCKTRNFHKQFMLIISAVMSLSPKFLASKYKVSHQNLRENHLNMNFITECKFDLLNLTILSAVYINMVLQYVWNSYGQLTQFTKLARSNQLYNYMFVALECKLQKRCFACKTYHWFDEHMLVLMTWHLKHLRDI